MDSNARENEGFTIEQCLTALYKSIHEREPDTKGLSDWSDALRSGRYRLEQVVSAFLNSDESRLKRTEIKTQASSGTESLITHYHTPTDLQVGDLAPRRILLLGSCLIEAWRGVFAQKCAVDYIQINNLAQLPPAPPQAIEEYDFQIVQIPLRHILHERSYGRLNYDQPQDFEKLFDAACTRMIQMVRQAMRWNAQHGILSFVCNFLIPQYNPLGRLLPRYDLRNIVYFVEQLNQRLADEVASFKNAYILDIDNISSMYGRKYHQDDALAVTVHHGVLGDFDFGLDTNRLEPVQRPSKLYGSKVEQFISAIWSEASALYRTIRQADAVKIVIMDLDDSLWRGIAAEGAPETLGPNMMEGWPVGLVDALLFLKKRGILLAIVSKNSEDRIRELWSDITADRITLEDFAIRRINWNPKAENVREVLALASLLPKNAVFVDDNPVERAAVKQAFPDIRTLGHSPYETRRILLWAPETQVVGISEESTRRTEMIQAQVKRETDSKTLSRDEFLSTLDLTLKLQSIDSVDASRFPRAFELLNKTNQFNTTGVRWTHEAVAAFFNRGGRFLTFEVKDIYTNYGLVGVVLIDSFHVKQWAMSCRVIGLDVEIAAMHAIANSIQKAGHVEIIGEIAETEANFLCRDLFERCGFEPYDGRWRRLLPAQDWVAPPHVKTILIES
ncbi:HAD-IIIC family phosphatase [Burkholderia sp. Bmkn7]|uniref:HAD-IIIC family phosphatase n=1 Tax=Burkholderia sp. Bmkn7 TaxID=3236841 RepID=UPI0034E52189